jgi:hypothetical protein
VNAALSVMERKLLTLWVTGSKPVTQKSQSHRIIARSEAQPVGSWLARLRLHLFNYLGSLAIYPDKQLLSSCSNCHPSFYSTIVVICRPFHNPDRVGQENLNGNELDPLPLVPIADLLASVPFSSPIANVPIADAQIAQLPFRSELWLLLDQSSRQVFVHYLALMTHPDDFCHHLP